MVHNIISSSLLILLLLLIRKVFKEKLGPVLIYNLSLIVIIRLLLPFNIQSNFSIMNLFTNSKHISSNLLNNEIINYGNNNFGTSSNPWLPEGTLHSNTLSTISTLDILKIIWIIGMAVLLMYVIYINLSFYLKIKREGEPLNINCRIPVYLMKNISSPCLYGIIRPKILVNNKVTVERQLEFILNHELTHYKYKDNIINLLKNVSIIIYWFNPLVWVWAHILSLDCEFACDARVIKGLCNEDKLKYGETLIMLTYSKNANIFAISKGFRGKFIKERILNLNKKPRGLKWAVIISLIVIIATLMTMFTSKSVKYLDYNSKNNYIQSKSKSQTLDDVISIGLLENNKYANESGIFISEAHKVLDIVEENGIAKVYAILAKRNYEFINGSFTAIMGSDGFPCVIELKVDGNNYEFISIKEPMDGGMYEESVKDLFPENLWNRALPLNVLKNYNEELNTIFNEKAEGFLKSIGRASQILDYNSLELKKINIDINAMSKIFVEYTKFDFEINKYPTFIGSRETIDSGVTYLFETYQSKIGGYDFVGFKKSKLDGTVISDFGYKIVNGNPEKVGKRELRNDVVNSSKNSGINIMNKGSGIKIPEWKGTLVPLD